MRRVRQKYLGQGSGVPRLRSTTDNRSSPRAAASRELGCRSDCAAKRDAAVQLDADGSLAAAHPGNATAARSGSTPRPTRATGPRSTRCNNAQRTGGTVGTSLNIPPHFANVPSPPIRHAPPVRSLQAGANRKLVIALLGVGAIAVIAIVVAIGATRGGNKRNESERATAEDHTSHAEHSIASADDKCSLESLKCDQFSTQGRGGMKLHELVFSARTAGRHAEAICLAQHNVDSTDGWLVGASHFETSHAWEALGCHQVAVREIEASLQVRPRGRSGWKETCDRCRELGGRCVAC